MSDPADHRAGAAAPVPTLVIEEEGSDSDALLLQLRRALWRHPAAAQALFNALVAEGRRFAATEEGRGWAERLERSALLDQVRVVWDLVSSRALEDDPGTVVPSVVAEAFVKAATDRSLEQIISLVTAAHGVVGRGRAS
jgi:hypothetical protein